VLAGDGTRGSTAVVAIEQALAEQGYVEGSSMVLAFRSADGDLQQLSRLAAELVSLPVDLIVATGPASAHAAHDATHTIPIVMQYTRDPIAEGLVASLARPAGNITGVTAYYSSLTSKRLELLRDSVPRLARVAVINPSPTSAGGSPTVQAAAERLGLQFYYVELVERDPAATFDAAVQAGAEGLIVVGRIGDGTSLARFADVAGHRLPIIYGDRVGPVAGGLMSYGPSITALYRQLGSYTARVLQGARPANLPLEEPREFEFVINLQTARALGLTIPHHVLLQATEVIE